MPLKTDRVWIERIKSIKSNNPGWGAERIKRQLGAQPEQVGRSDVPSVRTVGRVLSGLSDEELAQYRHFFWPESVERGDLPWRASATGLELLRFLDTGDGLNDRPPVRFVKWFWRVSQALPPVPEAPPAVRVLAAGLLTLMEMSGKPVSMPMIEWWLAYRPWEGDEQQRLYQEAAERKENPIPTWGTWNPREPLEMPFPSHILRIVREGGDVDLFQYVTSLFREHFGFELPQHAEWVDEPRTSLCDCPLCLELDAPDDDELPY